MQMEDVSEGRIRDYIEQLSPTAYYDDAIAGEEDFEVHYHLSSLRRGILSWYDFRPEGELLELGGGYGALTGLFCERCAAVTSVETNGRRAELLKMRHAGHGNLRVLGADWQQSVAGKQFDYVICLEAEKCEAAFLNRLAGFLKPDGRLLISYENCFGMKYICGVPEWKTGKMFGGIRGYAGEKERYSFSRGEICEALVRSVFRKYKFYYPLPDDRLPQLIYTDDRLPEKNVAERLIPYYESDDTLMCNEEKLYGDAISQGVFPFLANSFLVECLREGALSDISSATLSFDRGREGAFATVIHQTGVVCKRPLYMEGRKSAQKLYDNLQELDKRQIPIVPHTYGKSGLEMPFVKLPILSDYLRKQIPEEPETFLKVLRKLYQLILKASEEVGAERNALLPRMREQLKGQPEKLERLAGAEWGPIVAKAYVEMVPLNCFFDEVNETCLFFDQEYVRENYPAGYVLYRTVAISYNYIPQMEVYLPLQRVKDEFDLNRVWEFYECEEQLFLNEVRCRECYRQFLKWTVPDWENAKKKLRQLDWKSQEGRQTVLFGAGKLFGDYMRRTGKRDFPVFAVDNDSEKWGMTECGVEIRPPEALLEIPREKRRVLICCRHTAEIESQLKEMGVSEFWAYSEIMA